MKKTLLLTAIVLSGLARASASESEASGFDEAAQRAAVEAVLQNMTEGWNARSGAQFAQDFTADAVFTVWFGFQMTGMEEIAQGHQMIFDGIYAETDAVFVSDRIRFLGNDAAIAHVRGYLMEAGTEANMQGPPDFVPLMVLARYGTDWKIEAFQNTKLDLSNMQGGKDIRESDAE